MVKQLPFIDVEIKNAISDKVINGLISVFQAAKVGNLGKVKEIILELEQFIHSLPTK